MNYQLSWFSKLARPILKSWLDRFLHNQNGLIKHVQQVREKNEVAKTFDGGKGHTENKGRKLTLTFREFLAKYQNKNATNLFISQAMPIKQNHLQNRLLEIIIDKERNKILKHHILHLGHKCQCHMDHLMLVSLLISQGLYDPWMHTPLYLRPYNVDYAALIRLMSNKNYHIKGHFDQKNQSRARAIKRTVK